MTALAERHRVARKLREIDPTRRPGRKTNRVRTAVTPTHERPELRLVFLLPPSLMVGPGGFVRFANVNVTGLGTCEVTRKTFNRDDLFEDAARFLRSVIGKGRPPMSFACDMTSSSEGHRHPMKWWLAYVDGHVFASVSPIGPLIFPAPPR